MRITTPTVKEPNPIVGFMSRDIQTQIHGVMVTCRFYACKICGAMCCRQDTAKHKR